jgi:hypothetical protein
VFQVTFPIEGCPEFNTGAVSDSCSSLLPVSSSLSSSCLSALRPALCAARCSLLFHPGVCPLFCDALFAACRDRDSDEDATVWCARVGLPVAATPRCFAPPRPAAAMSRVEGSGLAPLFGWSEYALRVRLFDAQGNGVLDPREMERVRVSLGGTAEAVKADGSATYTWFQQQSDVLTVTLDELHLPGSPFRLSVLPRPRCLVGAPRISEEPLCPAFDDQPSCCAASGTASLLRFAEAHTNADCRAAWRAVLCVAACHPQQDAMITKQKPGQFSLVISAESCRNLREACDQSDQHCTEKVVPWPALNATLKLAIGSTAAWHSGEASARHSTVKWSRQTQEAGHFGEVQIVMKDKAGLPTAAQQNLRIYARHLPTGQMFAIQDHTTRRFSFSFPHLLLKMRTGL